MAAYIFEDVIKEIEQIIEKEEDWQTLVQLWKYSNLHFVHVIKHVDAQKLNNKWIAGEGEEVSLQDMIRDYPRHLELHMGEVHALHELR